MSSRLPGQYVSMQAKSQVSQIIIYKLGELTGLNLEHLSHSFTLLGPLIGEGTPHLALEVLLLPEPLVRFLEAQIQLPRSRIGPRNESHGT